MSYLLDLIKMRYKELYTAQYQLIKSEKIWSPLGPDLAWTTSLHFLHHVNMVNGTYRKHYTAGLGAHMQMTKTCKTVYTALYALHNTVAQNLMGLA